MKRILIVQPYGIGDTLFIFPLIQALKKQQGVEHIDVIAGSRTRQLIRLSPYIHDIFVIDKDRWKTLPKWTVLSEKMSLLKHFLAIKYDVFIDFSMQPEYSFWSKFLARTPVRAGFDYRKRNPFLNIRLSLPDDGFKDKPVSEYVRDLAQKMGIEIRDKSGELRIPLSEEQSAFDMLREAGWKGGNYIVLSAGGGATWGKDAHIKQWPGAHFCEFLKRLEKSFPLGDIVLLGTSQEKTLAREFKNLANPVLNLCGKTSLTQAAAILKNARLFVGNDGGLVHIAATQNIPIIAFYGPADKKVYGPVPQDAPVALLSRGLDCQPCYRRFRYKQDCPDKNCLTLFSADEAWQELEKSGFLKKLTQT